jgi:hypothetical protein
MILRQGKIVLRQSKMILRQGKIVLRHDKMILYQSKKTLRHPLSLLGKGLGIGVSRIRNFQFSILHFQFKPDRF